MTKIKLCGLSRKEDILAVNRLKPDYIGFVFWERSRRYLTEERAGELKRLLDPDIKAVGVFIDEDITRVKELLEKGIIDIAQLHGEEDGSYIRELQTGTGKPVIKAFRIRNRADVEYALDSPAEHILFDSGAGSGKTLDWSLIEDTGRPFFLAGGLNVQNAAEAVRRLRPFAVDVSSGIETEGLKDEMKMIQFVNEIRRGNE